MSISFDFNYDSATSKDNISLKVPSFKRGDTVVVRGKVSNAKLIDSVKSTGRAITLDRNQYDLFSKSSSAGGITITPINSVASKIELVIEGNLTKGMDDSTKIEFDIEINAQVAGDSGDIAVTETAMGSFVVLEDITP
ncbi:MAG: hypothetical protein F6J93_34400 [Oscillatoria sp. SIO1A7]|nr:hypothetical protein [Oscillatoria sp. SIO1A7]